MLLLLEIFVFVGVLVRDDLRDFERDDVLEILTLRDGVSMSVEV